MGDAVSVEDYPMSTTTILPYKRPTDLEVGLLPYYTTKLKLSITKPKTKYTGHVCLYTQVHLGGAACPQTLSTTQIPCINPNLC